MPSEVAIAAPFESEEIIEIAVREFRDRLRGLCPLQGAKQYAGFKIAFNHAITLCSWSDTDKKTLAWGSVEGGDTSQGAETTADEFTHQSDKDVNEERMAHDLPLIVETSDGHGGKVTKKVKMDGKSKKAKANGK